MKDNTTPQQHFETELPFDIKIKSYDPLRSSRHAKEQTLYMESVFVNNPKPSTALRGSIASKLKMASRTVQIWFQNRRAQEKRNNNSKIKRKSKLTSVSSGLKVEDSMKLMSSIEQQQPKENFKISISDSSLSGSVSLSSESPTITIAHADFKKNQREDVYTSSRLASEATFSIESLLR